MQLLVYGINAALKNIGLTDAVREFPRNPERPKASCNWPKKFAPGGSNSFSFLAAIRFTMRRAAWPGIRTTQQPIDWADLQKKVPDVVRLGYHEDATSALSHWHVPAAHFLESWGDALTRTGAYLSIQPMILPLFGGISEIELMNVLLGRPETGGT